MIGTTIQSIRKQKGISLSECASRANISKSYLSNLERNINRNPSILIVGKIAEVLDVNLNVLLGFSNDTILESEWIKFVNELKASGVKRDQLREYKSVIEFAKWQNEKNIE